MIICIDIGGGTTRVGFSEQPDIFTHIERFATRDGFDEEMKMIIETITPHASSIEKIIIAAAGAVDRKQGKIISWGQKQSWWGKSVFDPLSSAFPQATLLIENDANIAALGESVYGAGKMYSLVGYVTLSSGIGGCLIHNRTIVPHTFGLEPAHQIVNFQETEVWSCGQKGCFESYASGTAFTKRFGMLPEACTDSIVWKQYARLVAVGLANIISLWSPEVMIIGGGVANKFDSFIGPLEKEVKRLLPMYDVPKITRAELSEAGLYGGLVYKGAVI